MTVCLSRAYLFPATSRTCSSAARDTSAGIRVSLLSRMQNTVRLLHPPIYDGKENMTVFQVFLGDGGGTGGSCSSNGMKRMHKITSHDFKSH